MSSAGGFAPGGLRNLWVIMINFNVYKLCIFLHMLELEETASGLADRSGFLTDEDKTERATPLNYGKEQCEGVKLTATLDRIERVRQHLARQISWGDWHNDVQTLRETLIDDLKQVYCYQYPTQKAEVYWAFMDAWKPILTRFPSALEDALAAVDCYGLNHNTACVFHSMRVAELGLRALARERRVKTGKKPLEWAQWQEIISGIRTKIKKIEQKRAGPARSAALDFYHGSLGEFEAFKDAYRNNVMHVRKSYDEHQALSVLNHVREFMGRLSEKIGEIDKAQIKWGLR